MSSVIGVIRFNTTDRTFRIYNHQMGITRANLNLSFHQAGPDAFYITAGNEYCKVDLSRLNDLQIEPYVYIDQIKIFNEEKSFRLDSTAGIVLHPDENFFSFEFGCIDYLNQDRNQFSYCLIGWDKDWVYCGNRRYASYTNLAGGDYEFMVRVATPNGRWGEPVSLRVHIQTPFYKQTWFSILLILFVSGLIFMAYSFRIRSIQQTEKLKTEFNRQLAETRIAALRAQMNPHFIFNCLNSINRYVVKNEVKTASLYITKFAKLIRLILDNSEHKRVVLSNELDALKLYIEMESLRFDKKFDFEIIVDEDVDTDQVDIPPLLIQPYVENAIWHGLLHKDSEGLLSIQVSGNEHHLICKIQDNGIGRKQAMAYKSKNSPTRKSLGMKLTEERLKLNLWAEDETGDQKIVDLTDEFGNPCGTLVILTIPF